MRSAGFVVGAFIIAALLGSSGAQAQAPGSDTLDSNPTPVGAGITRLEIGAPLAPYALAQNYPNPFNPTTRIQYVIEKTGTVSLKLYNLLGLELATLVEGRQEAGSYSILFNASEHSHNLASGIYLYRLEIGSFVSVKKLAFIK